MLGVIGAARLLRRRSWLVLVLVLLLSGCTTEPRNLYTAHHTVVGVDAAVSNDLANGHLLVGYDRRFATVSPRSNSQGGGAGKEVMSVLSCSSMEVKTIFLSRYRERLATGEAATTLATKGDALKQWRQCLSVEPDAEREEDDATPDAGAEQ